jgi:two-component system chemotaxis response regulator CheY
MKKYSIVIVDDAIFMRKYLKDILKSEYMLDIIGEADDGYSAIKEARKKQPDIMTLDITMEYLDGLRALPKILEVSKNTKVIIVSAMSKRSNIISAIKLGASGFISKPFEKKKVIEVIKKCIEV